MNNSATDAALLHFVKFRFIVCLGYFPVSVGFLLLLNIRYAFVHSVYSGSFLLLCLFDEPCYLCFLSPFIFL